MSGGNTNLLLCEGFRDARLCVAFGCERDYLCESAGGIEQPLHRIDVGRLRRFHRMSSNVARLLIEEWALDMDAPDHSRDRRVRVAYAADIRQSPAHRIQVSRNDSRQNSNYA